MSKLLKDLDLERFVLAWRSSVSAVEVGGRMGITARRASAVACTLRRRGVELDRKRLWRQPARVDVDRLNAVLADAAAGGGSDT